MTNLTTDQENFLAQITAARARYDKARHKAEELRAELDVMLSTGRTGYGISTHRLAQAANLSQPRIQQLTTRTTRTNTTRGRK